MDHEPDAGNDPDVPTPPAPDPANLFRSDPQTITVTVKCPQGHEHEVVIVQQAVLLVQPPAPKVITTPKDSGPRLWTPG